MQRPAANAVLTTVVDTWGRSWTLRCPSRSSGLIRRTAVDSCGPGHSPEKRKVTARILLTPVLTTPLDEPGCGRGSATSSESPTRPRCRWRTAVDERNPRMRRSLSSDEDQGAELPRPASSERQCPAHVELVHLMARRWRERAAAVGIAGKLRPAADCPGEVARRAGEFPGAAGYLQGEL